MKINLQEIVSDSFKTYAGMTIKERAIIDARDGLKPSQRQCMYSQLINKHTYKKPFEKSLANVGDAMKDFYIHGDASCYALLVQMARSYNMNYPLEDFKGQYGDITKGKPSADRYTEMRLGELGYKMFDGIDKDCIDLWFDNYNGTKQYPSVLPSLGFYNICNGTMGIATGIAASIPQFNVKEVNEAMIKLLWDRDIDFDEIYCAPDFCIGGTIMNASEVKEILKVGQGGSVKMRATVEYDEKKNALTFTEVPYGVYVGTIIEQLEKIVNENTIGGIKDFVNNSTKTADILVRLEKDANPTRIVKQLFKETSLQKSYSIVMNMLDRGTTPKIFGWREALLAHIDHEIEVRTKIHEFEIGRLEDRLNIVNGFIIAALNVEELVKLIHESYDDKEAKSVIIERFGFNDAQADAILKLTLRKLTGLEIQSFTDERDKLLSDIETEHTILNDHNLLYKEIETDLRETGNKYGGPRKTRLMDFDFKGEDDDAEPVEIKELLIHFTNLNNIYTQESSTLMTTRRGGKGSKLKLGDTEVITNTLSDTNFSTLLAFTNKGRMCALNTDDLPLNAKVNTAQLFELEVGEKITKITTLAKRAEVKYFIFTTKNGMIKKTKASEYEHRRGKSIKAINLKDGDEVVNVHFMDEEKVGILTLSGNFVIINTDEINAIGRATAGVRAIKLKEGDEVIASQIILPQDIMLLTISQSGLIKKSDLENFPVCSRGIIGKKISGTKDEDRIVKFLTIEKDCDIIVISNKGTIKISTNELRSLSRDATGVKALTLNENVSVVDMVKSQS